MKRSYLVSKILVVLALLAASKAFAAAGSISSDALAASNIPSEVVRYLLEARVLIPSDGDSYTFDDKRATEVLAAEHDPELNEFVLLLSRMAGSDTKVQPKNPEVMSVGSQDIAQ